MSFLDDIRRIADEIRGKVPGDLGLRPHTVTVRVRTWTGARAGLGTKTDCDTIVSNAGGYGPRVRQVSAKDVISSGGMYEAGDYKIERLSREHLIGGVTDDAVNPPTSSQSKEVFFKVEGPGFPDDGAWFDRVNDEGYRHHTYATIVIRRKATTP